MKKAFYNGIAASLISICLNFFFKILTAHYIDKSELTLYFTAIDIFTLTLLVLVGFRSSMVVTFAHFKDDKMIINIFRTVLAVVVLAVWALVIPFLKHKVGVDIDYWYLVATVIALSLNLYYSNIVAMYRLYPIINKTTVLDPLLLLAWFSFSYFIVGVKGIQPLFIATIMSTFMLSVYIYVKKNKSFPDVSFQKPILDENALKFIKNSAISTVEFGSGIVLLYTAVFLMMRHYSLNELGNFQVVSKPILSYMIMLFVFPIFRFVLPELSKLIAKQHYTEIFRIRNWILKYALIVSGSFIVLSLFFSQDIINLLFPVEYTGASLMIEHLSFFFIFLILNAYQIALIKASGRFLSALFIRISGVVTLLVAFYFIYHFYSENIMSIIVALDASYLVMFCISFVIERKILKEFKNSL